MVFSQKKMVRLATMVTAPNDAEIIDRHRQAGFVSVDALPEVRALRTRRGVGTHAPSAPKRDARLIQKLVVCSHELVREKHVGIEHFDFAHRVQVRDIKARVEISCSRIAGKGTIRQLLTV